MLVDLSESLFSALDLLDSLSLVISPHPYRFSNGKGAPAFPLNAS